MTGTAGLRVGGTLVAAMSHVAITQRMSAAEYLAWERLQRDKHEYHFGEILAMSGGSPRHNFLSGALIAVLTAALRGRRCHVLTSAQRVSAKEGERYVYADVVVACGGVRLEPGTTDVLANPSIGVEVISPSTERYDRGEKWDAYQRLPSLTDYLLVSQTVERIEHYQRESDGSWRYRQLERGETVTLANGATFTTDAVFEGAFELSGD